MNNIDKYLKATRNILIKPQKSSIEDKILSRIENLSEEDVKLLDEKFLNFLRKSNSRIYLTIEKIINNPGKFLLILFFLMGFLGFSIYFIILVSKKLSSSENKR